MESLRERSSHLGLTVPPGLLSPLERYYLLLARWNRRINLTALPLEGFPASTLDRLIFEPLAAAETLGSVSGSWFDIGSGGGSPAIPLRLALPRLQLTMVESKGRKAAFLREAVRQLCLEQVTVLTSRIEDITVEKETPVGVVTVRALRLEGSVSTALRLLLQEGGRLILFGGAPPDAQDFQLVDEQLLPGGSLLRVFSRR